MKRQSARKFINALEAAINEEQMYIEKLTKLSSKDSEEKVKMAHRRIEEMKEDIERYKPFAK